MQMHRVLITGAGGRIGRGLRGTLRGVHQSYAPTVPVLARDGEEVDQTDIADTESGSVRLRCDCGIIHLGGISGESTWRKSSKATSSAYNTLRRHESGR
jgi:uronate dehydrogenase